MPLWLRLPFWFCALTSEFCSVDWAVFAFIHEEVEITRHPTKSGRDPIARTSWSWDGNLLVACRCIVCLRDYSDTDHGGTDGPIRGEPHTLTRTLAVSHVNQWKRSSWGSNQRCSAHCHPCCSTRGGGDLVSCILSMQDITLRRTTDPHILPWGSRI